MQSHKRVKRYRANPFRQASIYRKSQADNSVEQMNNAEEIKQ